MKLALELSEAQTEALVERANSLGIAPEELARAVIADATAGPTDDFREKAEALLQRNAELYRRLA